MCDDDEDEVDDDIVIIDDDDDDRLYVLVLLQTVLMFVCRYDVWRVVTDAQLLLFLDEIV